MHGSGDRLCWVAWASIPTTGLLVTTSTRQDHGGLNTHTLGEDQLHLAKAHPVHSAATNKRMLALIFFFNNKIRLACLHHVPLFKFIEQFQPFNPNQQMAKMRIFTRLLQKQWSIPMQSVEKKGTLYILLKTKTLEPYKETWFHYLTTLGSWNSYNYY